MLSRAVSGVGAYTQLYSGAPVTFYVDDGTPLPGPLDPGSLYVYKLVDANGTSVTNSIQPQITLNPLTEPLTPLFQRLIQGAINSLVLPAGIERAQVVQAMPNTGFLRMPIVVINLDLMQQEEIPIGQSLLQYQNDGTAIVTGLVHRSYKISILCDGGNERDFYRDVMPGILEIIVAQVLTPGGLNVTHRYQISSGQVAYDYKGKAPGFFFADAMFEFTGTLNIAISNTSLGLIREIDFTATTPDNVPTEAIIT